MHLIIFLDHLRWVGSKIPVAISTSQNQQNAANQTRQNNKHQDVFEIGKPVVEGGLLAHGDVCFIID